MQLTVSEYAGFCFGVERAARIMEDLLAEDDKSPLYMLGELIHNPDYIASLKQRGVRVLSEEEIDRIPKNSRVVLRTHGITVNTRRKLEDAGVCIYDATCPFVRRAHEIVCRERSRDGVHFLVVGDSHHPEITALISHLSPEQVSVVSSLEDCKDPKLIHHDTVVLLAQTTANHALFRSICSYVQAQTEHCVVYDTVCEATEKRQADAEKLARHSDRMIVIGGLNSSNTQKLAEISARHCKTIHIERADDIPENFVCPSHKVGITAGASTPRRIIEEVVCYMTDINNIEETMSFEEMLEQSFKTLTPGAVATGIITRILPAEMHVDLGIKHTGILPQSEVSDDASFSLSDNFKIGDEVTVLVQKFNDAEGTVLVSKKKLDNRAGWQKIVEAYGSEATLTGTVAAAIKGGILIAWEGQNIFVPGSLTGLPKEADLHSLVGQETEFKLVELDEQKRRTVVSIRAVQREKRRALAEKFWESIEVGKVYTGTVKSLTSYGAFVDLGGADGMVHITELSWKRLSHPSEVVSIGQEITVYVKDVNFETRKISLGYKTEADNPWNQFAEKFSVGDVTKVTIVNMTPFGAFAEVLPGVDGLIHISQITNKHLTKPQDVLTIGEVVDAEIIGINHDTKKISLSMRSLLEEEAGEEEAPEADAAPAEEAEPAAEAAPEAPAEAPAEEEAKDAE